MRIMRSFASGDGFVTPPHPPNGRTSTYERVSRRASVPHVRIHAQSTCHTHGVGGTSTAAFSCTPKECRFLATGAARPVRAERNPWSASPPHRPRPGWGGGNSRRAPACRSNGAVPPAGGIKGGKRLGPRVPFAGGELHPWLQPAAPSGAVRFASRFRPRAGRLRTTCPARRRLVAHYTSRRPAQSTIESQQWRTRAPRDA